MPRAILDGLDIKGQVLPEFDVGQPSLGLKIDLNPWVGSIPAEFLYRRAGEGLAQSLLKNLRVAATGARACIPRESIATR